MFLIRFEGKKINFYFSIFSILTTIACLGYVALVSSKSLNEAILANKIVYVGGCFAPLVLFFAVCSFCNVKLSKLIRLFCYGYSFFVFSLVCTIGYNDFYYKDVQLLDMGSYSTLKYNYGFGHNFFYLILYGYIAIEFVILIYNLSKNNKISKKSIISLLLIQIITVFLFALSRMFHLPFEIMPLVYIVDNCFLFFLHRRMSIYNIEDCVNNSLQNQDTYGYILFDIKENYIGSNKIAQEIIPELEKCKIDRKIDNIPKIYDFLLLIKEFNKALKFNKVPREHDLESNDKHYICTVKKNLAQRKSLWIHNRN